MERECFENEGVARILNDHFISIKVDKEERPDVDGVYMQVCQSMTGSGGWPLTILMTPDQKPFYAGTYLLRHSRRGMVGLTELLTAVNRQWDEDAHEVIRSAEDITRQIRAIAEKKLVRNENSADSLMAAAVNSFKASFDKVNGGFGRAPKFPCPHNLLFLLQFHQTEKDMTTLDMVEKTLTQMYKGGIFDHIGYGFSRYSTDERWLAPHFEKMLYDNALLILAYAYAYHTTSKNIYKEIALKICRYVFNELTAPESGFYCAQDADSDGEEGRFYVFTPKEITACLGAEDGQRFCQFFDITERGNFEGMNIPNRLHHMQTDDNRMDSLLSKVYAYRLKRTQLHKDDKILTAWNGLMIVALASAYRLLDEKKCLAAAKNALSFIENNLMNQGSLVASWRDGKHGEPGFLDDYAFMIWAYLEMYISTRELDYIEKARKWYKKTVELFFDREQGGFYAAGKESEILIFKLKETYDGAIPSGNAVMAYNMTLLSLLVETEDQPFNDIFDRHRTFMEQNAATYPAGHCFYWLAVLMKDDPPTHIVCVLSSGDDWEQIKSTLPAEALVTVLLEETSRYPLSNGRTTFYVCQGRKCNPPVNDLQ